MLYYSHMTPLLQVRWVGEPRSGGGIKFQLKIKFNCEFDFMPTPLVSSTGTEVMTTLTIIVANRLYASLTMA